MTDAVDSPQAESRIAVIGLGEFGLQHLQVLQNTPGARVVAIADVLQATAEETARRYGIGRWYTDPVELLDSEHLDGVVIVTPASSHLELTRLAVERGVAVLVEKPIVADPSEAAEMLDLDRRGVVVPAHVLRFARPYRALFDKVHGSGIDVVGVSARRHRSIDHLKRFGSVGPVLMTMIHDIDQAIWQSGSRAQVVSAHAFSTSGGPGPDVVLASVEDADGHVWDLGASWIAVSDIPDRLELYSREGVDVAVPAEWDLPEALGRQAHYFLACARRRQPHPVISVSEAIHGIDVADAITKSASENGAPISVLIREDR